MTKTMTKPKTKTMTIKPDKTKSRIAVANEVLNNPKLSAAAVGVVLMILELQRDVGVSFSDLVTWSPKDTPE
jgi:hypothetical protein